MSHFTIICGLILFGVSFVPSDFRTVSQKPERLERLGIEITTDSNDKPLYLPVALAREKTIVAYVPVRGGHDVTAVRVEPVMELGHVRFEASAVTGDYESNSSCAEVHKLPARMIASLAANESETITIRDNLQTSPWRVNVKAVKLKPPMIINAGRSTPRASNSFQEPYYPDSSAPCGCATCGVKNPLWCCPARGECMGCGKCGTVCCPKG